MKKTSKILYIFLILFIFSKNVKALEGAPIDVFLSPSTGTFTVGSTFNIGVFINTRNQSVNTVNLDIRFDPKKVAVVSPSSGNSILGIWLEPPIYDNTKGFIKMSGVIPGGTVASSGLIARVTFKPLASGNTSIYINSNTRVLFNDGLGTDARVSFGKAVISLERQIQEGVVISSSTHPFQDNWYNNPNPTFSWVDIGPKAQGYSVILDSNPATLPESQITDNTTNKSFKDLVDGIWYFHIRSINNNVWSNQSVYQVKVDSTPPEDFKIKISKVDNTNQYLAFFNTIDTSSGVDHYEVGVTDTKNKTALPVFIESESPYVLPVSTNKNSKVIIRAFDIAGNTTEAYTEVGPNFPKIFIVSLFILIIILIFTHYILGHHIGRNLKKAYYFFKHLSKKDDLN